jgi:hypothetical protein
MQWCTACPRPWRMCCRRCWGACSAWAASLRPWWWTTTPRSWPPGWASGPCCIRRWPPCAGSWACAWSCWSPASPSPRGRSSGPTGIWRPRSCRCDALQIWATCRRSRTPGPSRWPGAATIAGWAAGSPTPWPPSDASCVGCPIRCPTSTCGPRSGSNATGSYGCVTSTTRSRRDWPAAGSRSGSPQGGGGPSGGSRDRPPPTQLRPSRRRARPPSRQSSAPG